MDDARALTTEAQPIEVHHAGNATLATGVLPDSRPATMNVFPPSWSALLVILAWASPAMATVGGPTWIEVIGVDPIDGKVYLLEHDHGESGELPQLLYYVLDRFPPAQAASQPVVVTSWYEGDPADVEAAFEVRLERLRDRTVPLEQATLDGITETTHYLGFVPCPEQPYPPSPEDLAWALESAVSESRAGVFYREHDQGATHANICLQVDVDVRWDGRTSTVRLPTWGGVEVSSAWTIPGSARRLIILRHTGVTFETGYAEDVPLLLQADGEIEPPDEDPTDTCRLLGGQWSGRPQAQAYPGEWIPDIAPQRFTSIDGELTVDRQAVDAATLPLELATVAGYDCPTVAALRPMGGGFCVLGGWGDCFGGLGLVVDDVRTEALGNGGVLVLVRVTGTQRGWFDGDLWLDPADSTWWVAFGVDLPGFPGVRDLSTGQPTLHQVDDLRLDRVDDQGRILLVGEQAGEVRFVIDPASDEPRPEALD